MPRVPHAALLALMLAAAATLTACGEDDGATTQGAATTPPSTTAPSSTTTSTSPMPAAPDDDRATPSPETTTTLGAPGTPPPATTPTITEVQRPARALRCPDGGARGGASGDWDARELLGLATDRAEAVARRNGCAVRVVVRDGQELVRTMDYSNARVNVTETDGRVVALNGIG